MDIVYREADAEWSSLARRWRMMRRWSRVVFRMPVFDIYRIWLVLLGSLHCLTRLRVFMLFHDSQQFLVYGLLPVFAGLNSWFYLSSYSKFLWIFFWSFIIQMLHDSFNFLWMMPFYNAVGFRTAIICSQKTCFLFHVFSCLNSHQQKRSPYDFFHSSRSISQNHLGF